ncbi:MAG: 16S rRNA (cytosine(1402)-N(4))-methyltransferase RsmH [Pseudomonadota bacterium]
MEAIHVPVMLEEVMTALAPAKGGRFVDCTIGGGGHAERLLRLVGPEGAVLGLDQDPEPIGRLEEVLAPAFPNLILRRCNFSTVGEVLDELGWKEVDGMILDLGLGSHQLEESGRGFSFKRDEPLDMRFDPGQGVTAYDLVNRLPEKKLADLIFLYGEEKASRRIARGLVWARDKKPIETSWELANLVRRSLRRPGPPPRIDPATRTFQALRLAVNRELEHLEQFLAVAPARLRPGGRLAAISFHSLEDRLVKRALARSSVEGGPTLRALFKKPLSPSLEEASANPRSRSAKLRVGERM